MNIKVFEDEAGELLELSNLVGYDFDKFVQDVVKREVGRIKTAKDQWIKEIEEYKKTPAYQRYLDIKVEPVKVSRKLSPEEIRQNMIDQINAGTSWTELQNFYLKNAKRFKEK